MRNYWIFLAGLAVTLSFAILSAQKWAWLIAVCVVLRICLTRQLRLISVTLILASLMAGYFYHYQQLMPKPPTGDLILVQPDHSDVSGDQLRLEAQDLATKQKIQVYYYLPDQRTQQFWQHQRETLIVKIQGDYQLANPATNQAEFNYAAYLKQQKRTFYILNAAELKVVKQAPQSFRNGLHRLRKKQLLNSQDLPEPLGQYYRSLVLGYQGQDFKATGTLFKQLGLIHLFSLSGLHVYYFVALIQWGLLRLRRPREHVALLLLVLLPLYALFAGASTSLRRAVLLCWLHIFNQYFDLKVAPLDCFAVVVLVNLIYQPYLFFSLGGQLSYLLSFALLFLSNFSEWRRTLWLNLISLPLLLYHVYEWHWLTVFLNFLMMPLFSYAILPLTLLGGLVTPIVPLIGQLIAQSFTGLQTFLSWFAKPQFMLTYGQLPAILVCLCLSLLFFSLAAKHHKISYYLGLTIIYVGSFLWVHFPLQGRVIFFDIGQGDSILIESAFHREVTLIDTGGRLNFAKETWQKRNSQSRAERIIVPYLKSRGIKHIDQIFLSHQDADHVGDLPAILKHFPVTNVYFPAGMEHNAQFKRRIWPYRNQVAWHPLLRGQSPICKTFACQVLAPETPGAGTNEDSLVLRLLINQKVWLFTGDLPSEREERLISQVPIQADYLKAGHHGSKTSSSDAFLAAVRPKQVVISAGRHNRYGHPHSETLLRYQNAGIPFQTTAEQGMIIWTFDDRWRSFLNGEERKNDYGSVGIKKSP